MVRPNTGLSARETQILDLVVQGRTNPQIQEELAMNRKTLGAYLGHIYSKATPDLPDPDPESLTSLERRAALVTWGTKYLER